tara:strand:- start:771 stop:914 length:144 start_codon:yes stop_codon:yes gene_type:complete
MEDGHICDHDFTKETSLFGVFDGHGGKDVAKFAEENYSKILKETEKP